MGKQKKPQNHGKKVKIVTPTTMMTMDQLLVITMNMLSEQSFAQLVESVVAAIQANHLSNNSNGSPGGQKTGKRK